MALFTESNYYYLKRLFVRFFQNFNIKHLSVCLIIAGIAYLLVLILQKKKNSRWFSGRALASALLAAYYYLIILYTIVFRPVYATPRYHLELFWSYQKVINGSGYLIYEIVLNYILLLPVGLLFPIASRRGFCFTIAVGLFTSAGIECSQLFFRRGLFEFDDIIGNVFGVALGYLGYKIVGKIRNIGRN